ncbi:Ubx domain-containing protein [Coemansia sp. RSA 2131]|nr:Ubx domain-containing protein [Coemansia sp. RSA 2131]
MPDQHKVLEGLSDSQRQSLHEFSQVTNANDLDLAVRVLASRQWNTQQAIQMYYEPGYADALQKSDGGNGTQEALKDGVSEGLRRRGVEPSGSGRDTQSSGHGAESGRDTQSSGHGAESGNGLNTEGGSRRKPEDSASRRPQFAITPLLVWPFVLALQLATLAVATLLRILGIRRIASAGVPNQTTITGDFEQHFEARYGLEHPPFFHGTLADARTAALRDQKYIVMVLWSKEHDDADVFGRALAHADVVAYLAQSRFIVWAGDLTQLDAYAAAGDSGATHFPSISVLGPRAVSSGLPRLELLARMRNGPRATTDGAMAQSLISFVTRVVASRDSMTSAMRREQEAREAERRLRAQQNAAYEASLARDQERDRAQREQEAKAREQEAKAREQEIKAKEERDAEERRRREEMFVEEQRTQWRWAMLAQIHKTQSESATKLSTTDAAKLSLRLENGRRIVHSFAPDSTMQHVFDFVETRGEADEWAATGVTPYGSDLAQITAPAGYTHTYEFALVSQFPRVVFDDRRATLRDALSACGLWPSAVLIAEPLFEPED